MRKLLITFALKIIWLAAGKLGEELLQWMHDAELRGHSGRSAYEYVWRRAKEQHRELSGWLLNMLIETILGEKLSRSGKLAKKLKIRF